MDTNYSANAVVVRVAEAVAFRQTLYAGYFASCAPAQDVNGHMAVLTGAITPTGHFSADCVFEEFWRELQDDLNNVKFANYPEVTIGDDFRREVLRREDAEAAYYDEQ